MEIIPAIDLLDGACVRLHQGDYDQVTRFSDDPVAQALSWQEQGATRLHLVDLDGAKRGEPVTTTPSARLRRLSRSRCSWVVASAPQNGLTTCCVVASTGSFSAPSPLNNPIW